MNRAFFPVVKAFFIAVVALSTVAHAADEPKAAPAKADPAKGEALYTNGDPARNITACISCHGAAGASTISANPKTGRPARGIHPQAIDQFPGRRPQ